ncbi:MAG: hypothetical protein R2794_04270 [Chitinophagales bacterium]
MLSSDQFSDVILDETLFLIPDAAKLTKSALPSNSVDHWKGNASSGVAIVLDVAENAFEASDYEILEKLLKAIGLSFDNVLYCYSDHLEPARLPSQLAEHGVQHLLLFTDRSKAFDYVENEYYKVLKFNTIHYIISHRISDFNLERRTALWNALKQMFTLR